MKFGICVPNYGEDCSGESIKAVALEAEELGYDSLWTTDHILMPRSSGTPYERIQDCIVSLAYLAPLTKKSRLGISSLIIAMRNPLVVAKQLATIGDFSNGRLLLAIAAGWNETEFSFLGSDYHTRGKKVDESIELIRALWSGASEFRGKYIPQKFGNASFEPKPAEKLEIWIGGASEFAMKRAAKLGDVWHPNVLPMEDFRKLVERFREICRKEDTSENLKEIHVRIGLNPRMQDNAYSGPQGEKRILLSGDAAKNRDLLSELEGLGVKGAILVPNPSGKVSTSDQIEAMRWFAGKSM